MKNFLKLNRIIVIGLVLLLGFYCCGCVQSNKSDIAYTNEGFMSDLDFKELFANENDVKIQVSRNVDKSFVEMYDVPKSIKTILYEKTYEVLENLNLIKGYNISEDIHDNFKLTFDNLIQDGNINVKMSNNSGYYYVTVSTKFKKNKKVDPIKKTANYVGINGAIGYDLQGKESVDVLYLDQLVKAVNKNRENKELNPIDDKIEQINYQDEIDIDQFFENPDYVTVGSSSVVSKQKETNTEPAPKKTSIFDKIQNKDKLKEASKDIFGRTVRRLNYDAREFNEVAGIARSVFPLIPSINVIFDVSQLEKLSGYSCYDWGSTIKEVVANPEKEAEFVLVFKHNLATGSYDFYTMYPTKISTNLKIQEQTDLYQEFVRDQIKTKLEELHRALSDKLISTLTAKDFIYPQDLGLYLLKWADTFDSLNSDMWLEKIIRREDTTYLCEVYEVTSEIIKGTKTTGGKYLRKWLVRFKFDDSVAMIDDMYLMSLDCLKIPEMDLDKGSYKKIASLQNMNAKNITEEMKAELKVELNKLTSGLTYCKPIKGYIVEDKLRDNGTIKTITEDNKEREAWGFSSRFNTDSSILKTKDREDYVNSLKAELVKYGSKNACYTYGRITDWGPCTENQVELTANILFNFENKQAEEYTVYFVYSNFNNKWVIDEMKFMGDYTVLESSSKVKEVLKHYQN